VIAIVEAAGWPIWPLVLASVVALCIILERLWALRRDRVVPASVLHSTVDEVKNKGITQDLLDRLAGGSLLSRIFAVGLRNSRRSREVMKESIEESGRIAAHELERFLTTLGSIASLAPIMGLLGTVVGMIEIFGAQSPTGGNPEQLARGISIALYNTAFGLIVAIPSMIFYRHFRAHVDSLVVEMEMQALKLVEIIHGQREE